MESSDFNALDFFELTYPHISGPALSCLHLEAREGRTYGDRCGSQGWSSGKRSPVVLSDSLRDGPGQVPLSRDETQAAKDRRTRQVRAESARMVRSMPMLRPSGASIGAG